MAKRKLRFAFVASNSTWGGSEELWTRAALALAEEGHEVLALKRGIEPAPPVVQSLRDAGCKLVDLKQVPPVPRRVHGVINQHLWAAAYAVEAMRLRTALGRRRFDLTVLSQGHNLDGLFLGKRLRRRGQPYAIVCQKAAEMYWPYDASFGEVQKLYAEAERCFFVSEHNRRLTEDQIATPLPHAEVVRNPFQVPYQADGTWPAEENGLRLACVGRLHPGEKGQDLLLRVLARDKWRARPVSATFVGAGVHRHALQAMAGHLGLSNAVFAGFTDTPADVWRDHHALVLPSRAEGLPLVLVEAMLRGRVPIVTDVAGAAELVRDGKNGFLAVAPTEDLLDEAMERAWARRGEWRAIGEQAARDARAAVPPDPPRVFADRLIEVAREAAAG